MADGNSEYDQMCAICLEKWTVRGEHMALRLHCGHTFGCTCIRRWVRFAHNCPICKRRTSKCEMSAVLQNGQLSCDNRQSNISDSERLLRNRNARARRRVIRARRAMLRRMALAESTEATVTEETTEDAGTEV